jgi:hypothetical protein
MARVPDSRVLDLIYDVDFHMKRLGEFYSIALETTRPAQSQPSLRLVGDNSKLYTHIQLESLIPFRIASTSPAEATA